MHWTMTQVDEDLGFMLNPQHQLLNQGEEWTPMLTSSRSRSINRRREISNLIHQHPSLHFIADVTSESTILRCGRHPRARLTSNWCPQCAVATGTFDVTEGSFSQEANGTSHVGEMNGFLEDSIENTATIGSGCEDDLEEVSLDPKWAEALRAISIRLASERAQQPSITTDERDSSSGPVVHSDSPVDVTALEAREEERLVNCVTHSIPILSDLQRTIQPTKSIGIFSLDMESDYNNGYVSLSSFASDTHFVAKNFAESKTRAPRRGSLRSHQLDDHALWSQEFEFYLKQKYFGSNGTEQNEENGIGSGSSVTSSLTCESYNSLVSPPTFSPGTSPNKTSSSPDINNERADSEKSCFVTNLEMDVVAPMSESNIASRTSLQHSKLGPSSTGDRVNKTRVEDSFASTFVTRRSSSKKLNRHQDGVEGSVIGERTTRSSSPAKDEMLETPRKSLLSFLTALGRNSRSRSCSRPQKSHCRSKYRTRSKSHSRSKSCTRNHAKGVSEPTEPLKSNAEKYDELMCDNECCPPPEIQRVEEPKIQSIAHPEIIESPNSTPHIATLEPPGRCPIAHPRYKLGDSACDEDMIVFPASSQRRGRTRRRETSSDSAETLQSSLGSESNDREVGSRACEFDVHLAIGQLRHLDAVFIRRSDGSWTYALVADGNEDEIRFVVDDRGCTKVVPKSLWKSHVRRIKVLTKNRQGDRIAIASQPNCEVQINGRKHSFRGKEKGRLASPSPTRWRTCVLNLPTTIVE